MCQNKNTKSVIPKIHFYIKSNGLLMLDFEISTMCV